MTILLTLAIFLFAWNWTPTFRTIHTVKFPLEKWIAHASFFLLRQWAQKFRDFHDVSTNAFHNWKWKQNSMWFIIRFANHARGWKIENEKNCNTIFVLSQNIDKNNYKSSVFWFPISCCLLFLFFPSLKVFVCCRFCKVVKNL